jgi:hypothetical protein
MTITETLRDAWEKTMVATVTARDRYHAGGYAGMQLVAIREAEEDELKASRAYFTALKTEDQTREELTQSMINLRLTWIDWATVYTKDAVERGRKGNISPNVIICAGMVAGAASRVLNSYETLHPELVDAVAEQAQEMRTTATTVLEMLGVGSSQELQAQQDQEIQELQETSGFQMIPEVQAIE